MYIWVIDNENNDLKLNVHYIPTNFINLGNLKKMQYLEESRIQMLYHGMNSSFCFNDQHIYLMWPYYS